MQQCLEIMCCSCSVMVNYELIDQLPGGTYYKPNKKIIFDLKQCCPVANIVSDRDFAMYNQKMTQNQTFSDVAACSVIVDKVHLQVNLKNKLKNSGNCQKKQIWQNKKN